MSLTVHPDVAPLDLLKRYLRFQGWKAIASTPKTSVSPRFKAIAERLRKESPSPPKDFDLWELADRAGDPVQILVPEHTGSEAYSERIERALRTLAIVEQRPVENIALSVRGMGYDMVFSRIPDSLVVNESITLPTAKGYVTDVERMLRSAATVEITKSAFYGRVRDRAKDYADRCRFGHTFKGSFGFTIESPVAEKSEQLIPELEENPPYERLVIERFARGVRAAVQAVDTDNLDLLVHGYEKAFNANACEVFADLISETSPRGLTIGFAFSPEWRVSPDLQGNVEFRVDARHAVVTREAAKKMRAAPFSRPETIKGRIIHLHNEADPSDLIETAGEREIVVKYDSKDLDVIEVHVELSPEQYQRAYAIHGRGQEIELSGTLERKGRDWVLIGVSDFSSDVQAKEKPATLFG